MRDERGVTLAELLVVVAIIMLLMAGVTSFYSAGVHSWVGGSTRAVLQQSTRVAMDEMLNELIWASFVAITANGDYTDTVITYKKNDQTYKFLLQSGSLKVEQPSGTVTVVAENIQSVHAVRIGKMIELAVTAEKLGQQVVLRAKVRPRNM